MENILTIKEKAAYELKEASNGVPKSIYETISSFSNTSGGTIILGVKEDRPNNIIVGLTNVEHFIKDILNTVHNKTKVSYPVINDSDFEEQTIDGKVILLIHVKEADKRFKPIYLNGSINESYGRNHDGDYLLTKNQIKYLLNDNNEDSYDSLPNPFGYDFKDVNIDSLHSYRKELNRIYPNNIYIDLDDYLFMQKTGLLTPSNDKYVLTNAGVVLLTEFTKISKVFPQYLLDYQRNDTGLSKWDHRIATDEPVFSGNLYDFYELVIKDLFKDIPSTYVSENGKNIGPSLMMDCFKEILANAFSNHSFFLSTPLKIIRGRDELIVRNSGKMLIDKNRAIMGGVSVPRNSSIITFFRRIGVADRSGTGIPKMFSAMQKNHFPEPIIFEGTEPEDFTVVKLSFIKISDSQNQTEKRIINLVNDYKENGVSIDLIASSLNVSRQYVSKLVNQLISRGILIDNGKATKGRLIFLNRLED